MTEKEIAFITENVITGLVPTFQKYIDFKMSELQKSMMTESKIQNVTANVASKLLNEGSANKVDLSNYQMSKAEISNDYLNGLDDFTKSMLSGVQPITENTSYEDPITKNLMELDYSKFDDLI